MKSYILFLFICFFLKSTYSQFSPNKISGELYIEVKNEPTYFYIDVSVSLIGMGFSGTADEPKIYSNTFTNSTDHTQSIKGGSNSLTSSLTSWNIEHIEDGAPTAGYTWIGYGLYKINFESEVDDDFYFYLDYLDSDYPYSFQTPDITVNYDFNRPINSPIEVHIAGTNVYPINGQVIRLWADLYGQGSNPVETDFYVHGNVPIDQNETEAKLFTKATVDGNIIVPSGKTLTIDRNSYPEPSKLQAIGLDFNSSTSLTIDGTLNVQGTSSNPVTFDFISPDAAAKNGIKLDGSGSLSISHAIVKNAYNGISITTPVSGSPSIENTEIKNCYNGIVIQYGNKDADITIADNNIHDNTNYGISISNPDHFGMNFEPSTSDNIITSCNYGIYLNEANVDISGSEVSDCIYGLYLYRTNYAGGQPTITDVHSHDNKHFGNCIILFFS